LGFTDSAHQRLAERFGLARMTDQTGSGAQIVGFDGGLRLRRRARSRIRCCAGS
jgi:hypothetical protein